MVEGVQPVEPGENLRGVGKRLTRYVVQSICDLAWGYPVHGLRKGIVETDEVVGRI